MRQLLTLFALSLAATIASAQDMPLSGILAPGENWKRVPELSGVFSLAADGKGAVFAGETTTGRITRIDAAGNAKAYATVPGLRGMAVGPDGRLYVCQPTNRRLLAVDGAGKEFTAADELAVVTVVVSRSGRCYVTVAGEQAVYAVEPDGKKRRVAVGLKEPSGLAL